MSSYGFRHWRWRRLWSSSTATTTTTTTTSTTSEFQSLLDFTATGSDVQTMKGVLEDCKPLSDLKTALKTHATIIKVGYAMSPSVMSTLLSIYLDCGHLNLGSQLLNESSFSSVDLATLNKVIASFLRSGDVDAAKSLFLKMPVKDVVSWNSFIGGCVKNSCYVEALRFFKDMLSSNVQPDEFTFSSVIAGCARLGALDHALWVHNLMIEKNIKLNHVLHAALVDMYAKCGKIETAKQIFHSSKRSDVSIWNAMITGLALHGLAFDAISVFSQMEPENISPDSITFVGILTACSHCGLVEEGQKYFDVMQRRYFINPRLEHYGAMVDLFGRAGHLKDAYSMIKAMPMEPDAIIWQTLLGACKTHKNSRLGEIALANIPSLDGGDYVLLSNTYCLLSWWNSAANVRQDMRRERVYKDHGKSWIELEGVIHHFKAGDKSHPETVAVYKVLYQLLRWSKLRGFTSSTELVLMDVSDEEKEDNLNHHSEKLAFSFGVLKTSPGAEIRILKNLRTCYDCHSWFRTVSGMLNRVIIVRDRIRFHKFEGGSCSCQDYW